MQGKERDRAEVTGLRQGGAATGCAGDPEKGVTTLSRGDCAITETEWLRIESPQRCDVAGVGAMWSELARDRRFLWRAQLCGRSTTAPPPHLGG
jgi:hypothetical protein